MSGCNSGPSFRKTTDRRWKLAKGAVYEVADREGDSMVSAVWGAKKGTATQWSALVVFGEHRRCSPPLPASICKGEAVAASVVVQPPCGQLTPEALCVCVRSRFPSQIKFDNNAQEVGGWYIYSISDWRAVYQLVPHDDRGFTIDTRPERLQMWPPSRSGWAPLTAADGPAPRVIDDLAGTLDVSSTIDLQQTPVARQSMAHTAVSEWTVTRKPSADISMSGDRRLPSDSTPIVSQDSRRQHTRDTLQRSDTLQYGDTLQRSDTLTGIDEASALPRTGTSNGIDVPETPTGTDVTQPIHARMSSTMAGAIPCEGALPDTGTADILAVTHGSSVFPLREGEPDSLGSEPSPSLAPGQTAREVIIPNVLVMTATLDRSDAADATINTTLQSSASTAPLNVRCRAAVPWAHHALTLVYCPVFGLGLTVHHPLTPSARCALRVLPLPMICRKHLKWPTS